MSTYALPDPVNVAISPVVLLATKVISDYYRIAPQLVVLNVHVGTALQSVPIVNKSPTTSSDFSEVPPLLKPRAVPLSVFLIIALGPSHAA